MNWYWGIPFTVVIIIVTTIVSEAIGFNLIWVMMLSTAIWAAVDSKNLELKKYKSGISYSPVVVFILFLCLWIAAFPWYLHVRYKINNGLAELKPIAKVTNPETEGTS